MIKLKKILAIMFSVVLILSMNIGIFASEITKGQFFSDPEWEGYTLGNDYYIDKNGDVIYTYEQVEEVPFKYTDPSTRLVGTDVLIVKAKYGYNTKNKKLTFTVNIDCPTDLVFKPNINLALGLTKANSKNGSYSTAISKKNLGKVNYLKDYTVEYSGTNHYKLTAYISANDSNTVVIKPSLTFYSCRNRTGKVWDFYHTDPNSKVKIEEPQTNWSINQQNRPSNLNKTYQDTYNKTYGTNIKVGSDVKIDVHHVRPLKYGGSNNMSNLVHIPTSFHSKITGWFSGY